MSDQDQATTPAQKLAKLLDGHELSQFDDVVAAHADAAANAGLVIVFGASDDLMELRGAIDDEVGAWNGCTTSLAGGKLLINDCDEDRCPYFAALNRKAVKLLAHWDDADPEDETITTEVWTYSFLDGDGEPLDVEHADFTINEDGEPWCRGVVLALDDFAALEEGGS